MPFEYTKRIGETMYAWDPNAYAWFPMAQDCQPTNEIDHLKKSLARVEEQNAGYVNRIKELAKQLDAARRDHADVKEWLNRMTMWRNGCRLALEATDYQYRLTRDALAQAKVDNAQLSQTIRDVAGDRDEARDAVQQLEAELTRLNGAWVTASYESRLFKEQRDAALEAEKKALAVIDQKNSEIAELKAHPMHYGYFMPRLVSIRNGPHKLTFANPDAVVVTP
jgi:chromosome segregation ATPase